MKSTSALAAIIAAALAASSLAYGQDRRYDDRGRGYEARPDRSYNYDRGRRDYRAREYSRDDRSFRDFRRGERLPPEYRHRQYVVSDWRAHRLRPPPRGYQWVQRGNDYVLVAIATGIIAQLLLDHRY